MTSFSVRYLNRTGIQPASGSKQVASPRVFLEVDAAWFQRSALFPGRREAALVSRASK